MVKTKYLGNYNRERKIVKDFIRVAAGGRWQMFKAFFGKGPVLSIEDIATNFANADHCVGGFTFIGISPMEKAKYTVGKVAVSSTFNPYNSYWWCTFSFEFRPVVDYETGTGKYRLAVGDYNPIIE